MFRTLLALVAAFFIADAVLAQQTAEFGRASGDTIDAITKRARKTSGSIGMTQSTGLFRGRGYEATLGGELVQDRLWFFGAATVLPQMRFSPGIPAIDVKATAQPVDWTNVTATFTQANDVFLPASFLSLRSTSVLSDRMMVNFSFTTTR
jgi:hypothetical protein